MIKITISQVNHVDDLLNIINKSKGDILLKLSDGSVCAPKKNSLAKNLLKCMAANENELELLVDNQSDMLALINFMAQDKYAA